METESTLSLLAQLADFITIKIFLIVGIVTICRGEIQTGVLWLILSELWLVAVALGKIYRKMGT